MKLRYIPAGYQQFLCASIYCIKTQEAINEFVPRFIVLDNFTVILNYQYQQL
jgi:hypothetical protein